MEMRTGKFVTSLCLLLALTGCGAELAMNDRTVAVNAEGEVEAVPDRVRLSLVVERTDESAVAAKTAVDQITADIMALARNAGVQDRDLKASAVAVAPEYEWIEGKRALLGQKVERVVELYLRDIASYGKIVDAVVKAGASRVGNASFELSNREELELQALQRAVAIAQNKARTLAQGFDARLGAIAQIQEVGGVEPPEPLQPRMLAMKAESADADTPLSLGTQKIRKQLSVVFALE